MKSVILMLKIHTEIVRDARNDCNDTLWLYWAALEKALTAVLTIRLDMLISYRVS